MFHAGLLFHQQCEPLARLVKIVGLTLVLTAVQGVFSTDGDLSVNSISGCITFGVLLLCMILQYKLKDSRILHMFSVIIALVIGTVTAWALGGTDFSSVGSAAWFALPEPLHFGAPQFNFEACLLMAVVYLFVLLDTTGTWFTIQAITGEPMEDERIDRGTIGEGLGCLTGALFGGTPHDGLFVECGIDRYHQSRIPPRCHSRRNDPCDARVLPEAHGCDHLASHAGHQRSVRHGLYDVDL